MLYNIIFAFIAVIIVLVMSYFVFRSKLVNRIITKKKDFTKKEIGMYAILIGMLGVFCLYLTYWTYGQELWFAFMSSIILVIEMAIIEFVAYQKYYQLGKVIS